MTVNMWLRPVQRHQAASDRERRLVDTSVTLPSKEASHQLNEQPCQASLAQHVVRHIQLLLRRIELLT